MNKFQSIYRAFGSTVRGALHFDGGTSGSYDPNGQTPGNNYYGNSPAPVQPTESKAFSIVSLVTGILSVLIGCCCNPYIAIILGVVAIVFAALSKKEKRQIRRSRCCRSGLRYSRNSVWRIINNHCTDRILPEIP